MSIQFLSTVFVLLFLFSCHKDKFDVACKNLSETEKGYVEKLYQQYFYHDSRPDFDSACYDLFVEKIEEKIYLELSYNADQVYKKYGIFLRGGKSTYIIDSATGEILKHFGEK